MKYLIITVTIAIVIVGCVNPSVKSNNTPDNSQQPEIIEPLSSFLDREIKNMGQRVQQSGKKYRIIIGNFQLNDSEVSSQFAKLLSNEISAFISHQVALEEINRSNLKQIQGEQALGLSPLFASVQSSNDSPVGKMLAGDGILTGSYWLSGEKIQVYLKLLDIKTAQNIYTASGQIAIPSGIEVVPDNFIAAENERGLQQRQDFKFSLWTDKGKGAIYQDGDSLRIYCRSGKNCYIKIYHISAEGRITLVYPDNSSENNEIVYAGQTFTIPQNFSASQPYGVEVFKAIASSEPFSEIETYFSEVGNAQDLDVWQKIYSSAQGKISQDTCFYTIVK